METTMEYGGYAESIIDDAKNYDGLEVQGVRNIYSELSDTEKTHTTHCEVDNDNPEFFSVYAHLCEGGVECIGDFATRDDAMRYALQIGTREGWHVSDFTNS